MYVHVFTVYWMFSCIFINSQALSKAENDQQLSKDFFYKEYQLDYLTSERCNKLCSRVFCMPAPVLLGAVYLVFSIVCEFDELGTLKKPYIALLDGISMGGVSVCCVCMRACVRAFGV